jgi:tetratricopeptide (TPR) repeat protein
VIRSDLDDDGGGGDALAGREVTVCGRLLALSRAEVSTRVAACGGRLVAVPRPSTHVAVITDARNVGARRVERLRAQGCGITVLDEAAFLRLLGVGVDLSRLFSTEQLAQTVGVAPAVVRAWMRHGFLAPTRTIRRLHLFDFRQVACARDLLALHRDGVKPARLRRALSQLARWHSDAATLGASLASLLQRDELLVRLPDGRLAEPSGQLRLQFEGPSAQAPRPRVRLAPTRDPLQAFEQALSDEEHGDYAAALRGYEAALDGFGPEPEILFNIGNVLFALERPADAAAQFLDAVCDDPEFAQAWNNLGNALVRAGRPEHGVLAYRQALAVAPDYADAHFNLAETLHQAGASAAARPHFEAYLRRDPFSRWAARARARLQGAVEG